MNVYIRLLASVAFLALTIIGVPLLWLWAINTLFPQLNIPYTIDTWFAICILSAPLTTRYVKK